MGDSFYEYTLKLWLLTGKKHEQYKRMYLESVSTPGPPPRPLFSRSDSH